MKLTSVEIHPPNSSLAMVLPFKDVNNQSRFNFKGMVGLDADVILSQGSGGPVDFSLVNRTPAIVVELNPDYSQNETPSDLRDELQRMIWTSRSGQTTIIFKNHDVIVAVLSGVIIKFESPQFSKTQAVQITFYCEDPWLKAPEPEDLSVSISGGIFSVIDDISTAPHGFVFELAVQETIESIRIGDSSDESWSFEVAPIAIDGVDGFLPGDTLFFSSEINKKYLYLSRIGYGTPIQLADRIVFGSVWPVIFPFPAQNQFTINTVGGSYFYFIKHYPTYWGV